MLVCAAALGRHGCSEHHGCGNVHGAPLDASLRRVLVPAPGPAPLVPAPKQRHSQQCVSTAVGTSTAICNSACRSSVLECPKACFCVVSDSTDKAANLSLTMPAEDLARLMGEIDHQKRNDKGERIFLTDGERERLTSLTWEVGAPEVTIVTEKKVCKSLQAQVASSFCDINCNAEPANCPESLCSCDTKKQWNTQSGAPQAAAGAPAAAAAAPAQPKPLWSSHLSAARPAKLPEAELRGFYQKTWLCKNLAAGPCIGPKNKTLNIVFSGESLLDTALASAMQQGPGCGPKDKKFCEDQVRYMRPGKPGATVKNREEAIAKVVATGQWTQERCVGCFMSELPKSQQPTEMQKQHPFSREAGLHEGVQILDIGGASARGVLSVSTLLSISAAGLDKVKDVGFEGICFDIELTQGDEQPLVEAFERAFKIVKNAGLLVMVTTSHSAPYASSEKAKSLLITSWRRSSDIDIFSPQLYTSGFEGTPEFTLTPCRSGGGSENSECTWERLKPIKARWVLSLASEDHYPDAHEFFRKLGIKVSGWIQWKDPVKKDPRFKRFVEPVSPAKRAAGARERASQATAAEMATETAAEGWAAAQAAEAVAVATAAEAVAVAARAAASEAVARAEAKVAASSANSSETAARAVVAKAKAEAKAEARGAARGAAIPVSSPEPLPILPALPTLPALPALPALPVLPHLASDSRKAADPVSSGLSAPSAEEFAKLVRSHGGASAAAAGPIKPSETAAELAMQARVAADPVTPSETPAEQALREALARQVSNNKSRTL